MQDIRRSIHAWMRAVQAEHGWTAAEWARRAGVTATSLTRFLRDPDGGSVPGTETIGRLARAAGREPRFLPEASAAGAWRVPLLTAPQAKALLALGRDRAAGFVQAMLRGGGDCVMVEHAVSPRAVALRIDSPHLNAGGVLADDRIVLEPADLLRPRPGDLVVALDGASVCACRFHPPYLIPVSTDARCVPMRLEEAVIVGVGVCIIRTLRAPAGPAAMTALAADG